MQQEGWVLPLPTYIMGAVHHEMGIRNSQLIVSRCRLGLRRMFTKLEQRSWLKLSRQGQNSKRVTEDWKRLVVRQHCRIGQLQGGFKPSAVARSVRTINKTGAAKGIMRLPHRWERVLHNFGEYIEGL